MLGYILLSVLLLCSILHHEQCVQLLGRLALSYLLPQPEHGGWSRIFGPPLEGRERTTSAASCQGALGSGVRWW